MASKHLYRVYLWRMPGAVRVVEEVRTSSGMAALYQAMRARRVAYSPAAYVVPDNDRLPIEDYEHVRCTLDASGHSNQAGRSARNGVR
jgi:hypothetical protein